MIELRKMRIGLLPLKMELKGTKDRLASLKERVNRLEGRLIGLGERFSKLVNLRRRGLVGLKTQKHIRQFSGILIATFKLKNISTSTEALSLRSIMKALLPIPKTKYYTWEVYEKLK